MSKLIPFMFLILLAPPFVIQADPPTPDSDADFKPRRIAAKGVVSSLNPVTIVDSMQREIRTTGGPVLVIARMSNLRTEVKGTINFTLKHRTGGNTPIASFGQGWQATFPYKVDTSLNIEMQVGSAITRDVVLPAMVEVPAGTHTFVVEWTDAGGTAKSSVDERELIVFEIADALALYRLRQDLSSLVVRTGDEFKQIRQDIPKFRENLKEELRREILEELKNDKRLRNELLDALRQTEAPKPETTAKEHQ